MIGKLRTTYNALACAPHLAYVTWLDTSRGGYLRYAQHRLDIAPARLEKRSRHDLQQIFHSANRAVVKAGLFYGTAVSSAAIGTLFLGTPIVLAAGWLGAGVALRAGIRLAQDRLERADWYTKAADAEDIIDQMEERERQEAAEQSAPQFTPQAKRHP